MHTIQYGIKEEDEITQRNLGNLLDIINIGILNNIDLPTYIDKLTGTASCLDLCIASQDLIIAGESERGPDLGSDHFPIKYSFGISLQKQFTSTKNG